MPSLSGERVRFLVKPNASGSNGWLALRDDLAGAARDGTEMGRDLARRFASLQVWFSDLDDFDTRSPAKIIAMRAVGAGYLNPAYLGWILETLFLFCSRGKKGGEAASWKNYYNRFLKAKAEGDWLNDEAFRFVDRLLASPSIEGLLYPGVIDFYARLGAEKYLVTRNLERIAFRYSKVIPYAAYYHEVEDKAALVNSIVESRPDVRRYGLGGDSIEDAQAADALDFQYRKGRIDLPICLCRTASPRALDPSFNVFVGKDRSALASLLAT